MCALSFVVSGGYYTKDELEQLFMVVWFVVPRVFEQWYVNVKWAPSGQRVGLLGWESDEAVSIRWVRMPDCGADRQHTDDSLHQRWIWRATRPDQLVVSLSLLT